MDIIFLSLLVVSYGWSFKVAESFTHRVHRVVKPCNSFLSFSRHYMHYIHVKQQQ